MAQTKTNTHCHVYCRVVLMARHLSTSFSLSICFRQGHPVPVPNTCISLLGDLLSRPFLVDPEVDSLSNSLSWDTWTSVRDSISKRGQKNCRYLHQLSHGQSSLQEGEEWVMEAEQRWEMSILEVLSGGLCWAYDLPEPVRQPTIFPINPSIYFN